MSLDFLVGNHATILKHLQLLLDHFYKFGLFIVAGAAGGGVRISVSGEPKPPGATSTIAEEAVDQLQENEKLVAGNLDVIS